MELQNSSLGLYLICSYWPLWPLSQNVRIARLHQGPGARSHNYRIWRSKDTQPSQTCSEILKVTLFLFLYFTVAFLCIWGVLLSGLDLKDVSEIVQFF